MAGTSNSDWVMKLISSSPSDVTHPALKVRPALELLRECGSLALTALSVIVLIVGVCGDVIMVATQWLRRNL